MMYFSNASNSPSLHTPHAHVPPPPASPKTTLVCLLTGRIALAFYTIEGSMVQRTSKNIFDLPPEIHLMAQMERLGDLRKVYPVSKRFTAVWVIGQVFLAWGLMISPIVLAVILFSPSHSSILALVVAASTLLLLMVGSYMS